MNLTENDYLKVTFRVLLTDCFPTLLVFQIFCSGPAITWKFMINFNAVGHSKVFQITFFRISTASVYVVLAKGLDPMALRRSIQFSSMRFDMSFSSRG